MRKDRITEVFYDKTNPHIPYTEENSLILDELKRLKHIRSYDKKSNVNYYTVKKNMKIVKKMVW